MIKELIRQISQNKVAFMLALVAVATIVGPTARIFNTYVYYAAMTAFFVFNIGGKGFNFNATYVLLILGAVASLAVNDVPAVFNAWQRLAFFILMSLPISPMISNDKFCANRMKALNFMLWLSAGIGIACLFCYFFDVNYMINFFTGENSVNDAGWFGGITVHSMLMGPVSALGATFMTWYSTCKHFSSKRNKYIVYGAIFACMASAMLSASRGSTAAAIIGSAVVYILRNGKSGSRMTSSLIGLLFVGMVAQPLMTPFTDMVKQKQSENIEAGSTFYSRETKWENRLDEFMSNPLIGIGFCTVGVETDDYAQNGIVETGTSWLAVLSMLGLLGAISIWILVFKPMVRIYKRMNRTDVLFFGLFSVFLLHMATEGYIFAGGNFMFFYFWLFVGSIHAYLKNPNYEFF